MRNQINLENQLDDPACLVENLSDPHNVLTEQSENLTDPVKVLADQVDIPTLQLKHHINLQGNLIPFQYQESQEGQLSFLTNQVQHLDEQVTDLEEQLDILTGLVRFLEGQLEIPAYQGIILAEQL